MSASEQRKIIVEYWFRVLIGSDISIDDILKIALRFAKEYEKFSYHPLLSEEALMIEDDGRIVRKTTFNFQECNTFGTVTAKQSHLYHWKIKVMEMQDNFLNIGVVEANKCEQCLSTNNAWYFESFGYSYYAGDGKIYHKKKLRSCWSYGDKYGVDDIIDIWLDLRDNKNQLSFAKNEKKFGKAADVKDSTDYKLAISMYARQKKIELMLFEMI